MVVSSALLILGKNGYLVDFVVCMCNCVYMYVVFTHPMRGIRIVEDHKINIIKRVYFNFTAFNFVLLGNTKLKAVKLKYTLFIIFFLILQLLILCYWGTQFASLKCLWHVDHFELNTIKAQKTQEEILTFFPNCSTIRRPVPGRELSP